MDDRAHARDHDAQHLQECWCAACRHHPREAEEAATGMNLSLMFDARARGPGSRTRKKRPSASTIHRIEKVQRKLAKLGEVDVLTADDEYVCPVCEDISESGPYDIDTAESLIPAHVFCRCAFVPAGTLEDAAYDYNPYHEPAGSPGGGQFSSAPGGAGVTQTKEKLDPRVIDVGGDKWNKDIAVKLENDYQQAKPALDKIVDDMLARARSGAPEPLPGEEHEEEDFGPPEEWDQLSNAKQEEIEEDWYSNTHDEFLDSETNNWYDSGQALDQAKQGLADAWGTNIGVTGTKKIEVPDWAKDNVFDEVRADYRIPLTDEQLVDALDLHYEADYEGHNDPEFTFDESKLISKSYDPSQLELPGIEKGELPSALSAEAKEVLIDKLTKAFNKEAEDNAYKQEPPEGYFDESIKDFQSQMWNDMSDKQKFDWAKDHGHVEKPEETIAQAPINQLDRLPRWDPIGNKGNAVDYERTKQVARYMSLERAADLMVKRGVFSDTAKAMAAARTLDSEIWSSWKNNSASRNGLELQAAVAEELGGRARDLHVPEQRRYADQDHNGGWDGLKAYVRAKWETSQYLLDKADMPTLTVFRAINIPYHGPEERFESGGFTYYRLPAFKLERNGAQSTAVKSSVSNNWDGGTNRVVLRLQIPRTAAVSVPAYGQNVFSEQEVVVGGTAWKKWDAWANRAPEANEIQVQDLMVIS